MTTTTINAERDTEVDSDAGNAVYVTRTGSVFASEYAIHITDTMNTKYHTAVTVNGEIHGGVFGIDVDSSPVDIQVGSSGSIDGYVTGVVTADGSTVSNLGTITGGVAGALLSGSGSLYNAGSISNTSTESSTQFHAAIALVEGNGDGAQSIQNTGDIVGIGCAAIRGLSGTVATIVNQGVISSDGGVAAIALAAGNDSVVNDGRIAGGLSLGDGADTFDGRNGTSNGVIAGGAGNDTLYGSNTGDDILDGGVGADTLSGGGGIDTASYVDATDGVTVDLRFNARNTGDAVGDRLTSIEDLSGSAMADMLTGDAGANELDGNAGNDILIGGAGDDDVFGGTGNDTIFAGAGIDVVDGGNDIDQLSFATSATGAVFSLATLGGQMWNSVDTMQVTGIENMRGSAFADTLTGDGGINTLFGGAGNDILNGGSNNDLIDGGAGDDVLIGGTGINTVSYSDATTGVMVSLAISGQQNTIGAGLDTLSQFTYMNGSGFDDTLTGNNNVNKLNGGTGNDTLNGGGGSDVLIGGPGNDILNGGSGFDTASYVDATSGVTVDLALTAQQDTGGGLDTLSSIENATGSAFNDTLNGSSASNTLIGGAGSDHLDGRGGNDVLSGGTGVNFFVFDTSLGANNVDNISDFDNSSDYIQLSLATFTGLTASSGSALSASQFYLGTNATTADGRIGYDAATGGVFYDADGQGGVAAARFATVMFSPTAFDATVDPSSFYLVS